MDIALDEVVHFDAITSNPATGAVSDADSTPTWSIFEEDTDTAILSAQNFTKRTGLTGNYRGAATLSAGNGFEAGKWYNVIGSATVNSVAGKGVVMRFRVVPAESLAGYPKVDVHALKGVAQSATDLTDFADTGYDPATHKVAGVATTDAVTTVNGLAANVITAAAIANDAIGAAEIAADAVTKIQSGLSTLTQTQVTGGEYALNSASFAFNAAMDFTTAQKAATLARVTLVDTTTVNSDMRGTDGAYTGTPPSAAVISTQVAGDLAAAHGAGSWLTATGFSTLDAAGVRSAVGLATANLDTQLGDISSVTDQFVFTVAGKVDATADIDTEALTADIVEAFGEGIIVSSFSPYGLQQLSTIRAFTVLGPVIRQGAVTLVEGDDYLTTDGLQLKFANANGSWNDLTGATVTLYLRHNSTILSKLASVHTPTGSGQRVDVELPSSFTDELTYSPFSYQLKAILADTSEVTLEYGLVTVVRRSDE